MGVESLSRSGQHKRRVELPESNKLPARLSPFKGGCYGLARRRVAEARLVARWAPSRVFCLNQMRYAAG